MNHSPVEPGSFNLSRWAIGHPSIARFLFGLIILTGLFGLMRMGQKEDPDFTFRVMVVQAFWPGASLNDMQDQVVNKIERKLQETPYLDWVKSYTRPGSAIITLQVKGNTDADDVADAFYQVRKKVGDIESELPEGLLGPYFNDEFGDTYITLYALTGDGYSYPELKQHAIQARDVLLSTQGVEKAGLFQGARRTGPYLCRSAGRACRAERDRCDRVDRYRLPFGAHIGRWRLFGGGRHSRTSVEIRQPGDAAR